MNIKIELANPSYIDELEKLYNDLNDYLESGINYPGWIKGIYPTRQDAVDGIKNETLYVALYNDKIIGSIILNHNPEAAYHTVSWNIDCDYSKILVIHTFVVHPNFINCGIGKILMDFAVDYGIKSNIKSIRLDVYEKNLPAIKLYEKFGFHYIDTVDLGLGQYNLDWFRLYEKLL